MEKTDTKQLLTRVNGRQEAMVSMRGEMGGLEEHSDGPSKAGWSLEHPEDVTFEETAEG